MGSVKQALRAVTKIPLNEFCDQPTVARIGNRGDQASTRFEQCFALHQDVLWRFKVLQYVSEDDAVVTISPKEGAKLVAVQVGHHSIAVPSAGDVRFRRVKGDAIRHNGIALAQIL